MGTRYIVYRNRSKALRMRLRYTDPGGGVFRKLARCGTDRGEICLKETPFDSSTDKDSGCWSNKHGHHSLRMISNPLEHNVLEDAPILTTSCSYSSLVKIFEKGYVRCVNKQFIVNQFLIWLPRNPNSISGELPVN